MRTVNAEKFADKREEILQAAGRCFMRSGFHGATISAICAEARISPGHLYHYFASKDAIVRGLIQAGLDHAAERFNLLIDVDDIVGSLLTEIEAVLRQGRTEGSTLKRMQLEIFAEAGRTPTIATMVVEHSRQLIELAARLIRLAQRTGQIDPALDPDVAAAIVLSVLDGAETWSLRNPDGDFNANMAMLGTMLTRLLAPPP